jgi:hypothetical protein
MSETVELEGVRVRRYSAPQPELEALIPAWLRAGNLKDTLEVRPGRLWRWKDFAVKLFPARGALATQIRSSRAIRCANLHSEILPIRSPQPVLASSDAFGSSLLVYDYVEGRQMKELWSSDARAREHLPGFLAEMHKCGVYHGDFHLDQAIWDGEHWFLIDLEGIRHRLRNFLPKRLVEGHWSRVSFGLVFHCKAEEEEIRTLFEQYIQLSGFADDSDDLWKRICDRVKGHWEDWKRSSLERELQSQ